LIEGVRTPAELEHLFRALKGAITERILQAELTDHLDYGEGEPRSADTTNARNGTGFVQLTQCQARQPGRTPSASSNTRPTLALPGVASFLCACSSR
jgi:transposase-like protein